MSDAIPIVLRSLVDADPGVIVAINAPNARSQDQRSSERIAISLAGKLFVPTGDVIPDYGQTDGR